MLELRQISKQYKAGDYTVQALKDVNLQFRQSEFVSILGPSGGGKTTLLNIIGGLDKYDDGDLIINNISTKRYKDKDWDSYRNHSVGFVFQNYNLIAHQSVLSNVELALTLSGVSKTERKDRAIKALESVGLGDQINKKPNQLSGGQMQRVAIARALVNNPDILLADEPTGALDTTTSVQIMELLKEISNEKLVIMVTHNPDLAEKYSNRIIKILDGKIIDDSNPYSESASEPRVEKTEKVSMGFFTALSLSFKNLLTKKGRTFLTAFAGSIGIIGIAAILALSNGVQTYIDNVEEDTLSSFPLTIEQATFDMTSVMESIISSDVGDDTYVEKNTIFVRPVVQDVLGTVSNQIKMNNLKEFKRYIESGDTNIKDYLNGVQYSYDLDIHIYGENDSKDGYIQSNPNDIVSSIGFNDFTGGASQFMGVSMLGSSSIWSKLIDNEALLHKQYDLVAGQWPTNYNEVLLTVDKYNQINDYILYCLGMKNQDEIHDYFVDIQEGKEIEKSEGIEMNYSDFIGKTFKLVLQPQYFEKSGDYWVDKSDDPEYIKSILPDCEDLTIVGIIRPNQETVSASIPGSIAYLTSLETYVINKIQDSDIVKEQKENPEINILSGLPFENENSNEGNIEAIYKMFLEQNGASIPSLPDFSTVSPFPNITGNSDMLQISDGYDVSQIPEGYDPSQIPEGLDSSQIPEEYDPSQIPEGLDSSQIPEGYDPSQIPEGLDLSQIPEGFDLSQMPEGFDLSQMPEGFDPSQTQGMPSIPNMGMASMLGGLDAETIANLMNMYNSSLNASYEGNLKKFGVVDLEAPSSISLYANGFESKDEIERIIEEYNDKMESEGKEENMITYTDIVGVLISSVTSIVNVISYVLIAFVSISLVVSSIMIGIITYISVLERTKEIGILRAIGASKKDVARVFNAETLIVGLIAGLFGVGFTALLTIPANIIVYGLTDVHRVAILPPVGAVILVFISIFLTMFAGLIPARVASKKDPVVALRTE